MQAWVLISENSRHRPSPDTAQIDRIKQWVMPRNNSAHFAPLYTSAHKSHRIPFGRLNEFTPGPAERYFSCPPVDDRYGIGRLIRVLTPSIPDGARVGVVMLHSLFTTVSSMSRGTRCGNSR